MNWGSRELRGCFALLPPVSTIMFRITRVHINAVIAIGILAFLQWCLSSILEYEIHKPCTNAGIVILLLSPIAGIVYCAKMFASGGDDNGSTTLTRPDGPPDQNGDY